MRKIIIYFAVFLSILFPLSAADSSEASFEILAYRVGGEGEGPYFYVVDALSSSLQNLASGTVKDMTSYVSSFLGNSSTSADVDYLGSVILSFRVEGSALGTYYVSATVTDFALTSENELENTSTIKGRYAFDNFDIRFNDSHSEVDSSGNVRISSSTYDAGIKTTGEAGTSSLTPSGTDSIAQAASYSSAQWTVSGSNGVSSSSDYWICRGALRLEIDEMDPTTTDDTQYGYDNAPNGVYQSAVIVEWGTIS